MVNTSELLLGLIALCFAAVVVYLAFKLEGKKSSDLMKELKSIRELLEEINNKIKKNEESYNHW